MSVGATIFVGLPVSPTVTDKVTPSVNVGIEVVDTVKVGDCDTDGKGLGVSVSEDVATAVSGGKVDVIVLGRIVAVGSAVAVSLQFGLLVRKGVILGLIVVSAGGASWVKVGGK